MISFGDLGREGKEGVTTDFERIKICIRSPSRFAGADAVTLLAAVVAAEEGVTAVPAAVVTVGVDVTAEPAVARGLPGLARASVLAGTGPAGPAEPAGRQVAPAGRQ